MDKKLHTQIQTTDSELSLVKDRVGPFDTIYSWKASERYWVVRGRAWYVTYSLFFVLIIGVAAILKQYLLIMAVIAFVFLWFVQASIKPDTVVHRITPLGLKTYGKLFKWKDIAHFWFSEKHGIKFIHFDIPDLQGIDRLRRYTLLVEHNEDVELFRILLPYIDYGDRDRVGFNILARLIHGKYLPIAYYLPEENYFDDDMIEEDAIDTEATFNEAQDAQVVKLDTPINTKKKSSSKKKKSK